MSAALAASIPGNVSLPSSDDVVGGLFEDGAAGIPFVADGVVFESGGVGGGVFLPGALLHFFFQINECFHQTGFVAGDFLFAGGPLGGVASQGMRRRNVVGKGVSLASSMPPVANIGAYSGFCAAATTCPALLSELIQS